MKRCLILILLFLLQNISAQDTISFQDHFDDNRNGWSIGKTDDNYVQIKDGKFIYESKLAQAEWSYKDMFFDPQKDFTLECSAKQVSGVDNKGYGLVYGLDNGDNYQVFNMSGNSYYTIYEYRNKVYKELKAWTKPGFVNSTGTSNKMKIQKKGSKIYYYINDQEVFQSDYQPLKGSRFGFFHGDAMVTEFDDYVLRQNVPTKINLVKNMKTGLVKQNLGSNVNTIYQDKMPVISPDGKTLFAARQGDPANTGGDAEHDDIWYSEQTPDGKWSKAVNMGTPLNNTGSNFVISITPDNNTLLLGNTYKPDGGIKGGGFSMSRKTAGGWAMPTDVKMRDYTNVHPYTSSYLANNGKTMILGAELPKTEGGSDIYVSFLESSGEWSSPINLGPTINTFANDYTPFLASDGITLYYSTNGKRGYGEHDIFMSKRLDDSWTKWSEPENLGPEINTDDFDAYFTIPASGKYAYIASTKNSIGKIDIFEVKLPEELKPDPVVMVYGKVLNSKTKAPIGTNISYSNLNTSKEIGIASSNPVDGSYKIILPAGQAYSFHAEKKDYVSVSDNIDLTKQSEYKEIERDLLLVPIEEGIDILLNNVFFETNKSDILPSSYPELDRLAGILNEHPDMTIELSGHTDNVGADADNVKLTQSRSESVMKYLVNKGIKKERLVTKGYGESKPVESNDHEAGRAKNRRMEFKILKKM